MGPLTMTQRVEELEGKMVDLDKMVTSIVSKVVDKAMDAMRHSLTEVLMEGQNLATKKLGAEIEH